MNYHKLNFQIFSSLRDLFIFIGLPITILASLSSCSDDTSFSGNRNKNGIITFAVSTNDNWNTTSSTRSSAYPETDNRNIISMTSPDASDSLFLIVEEREGINPVNSSKRNATRSELINNDNISSFGVFAALRPDGTDGSNEQFTPDYMYNVEVTKDNQWSPDLEYLWPSKAMLHINAYHPFVNSADELSTEGITALPDKDAASTLTLSFSTPADVADQFDLMWATPVDANASPCQLEFNHALSAIKFAAGAELAPCKIKRLEITDVQSSGILNIETGEWVLTQNSDLSENETADYSVAPDISLTAAPGSNFVASGTPLVSDDETMLLIPQSLSPSSQINLTIESDGKETTFSASLEGQIWTAGKTVIYKISASPKTDTLILEVADADGKPVSTLQSHYFGGDLKYSVISNYTIEDSPTEMIPWKAEFVDDDGNVIKRPQWITDFPLSGDGNRECVAPTIMQEPTFAAMSSDTRLLRQAADVNASSGYSPYNLSNSKGASSVENTANCYVVSAPGSYSLPLVYGNAIKNGATNKNAYEWNTHTKNVLKTFINHLGNDITDPYIYNNSGCEPADAYLVWEGRLCLIENVRLSGDKHSVIFDVPATYIRQGNALIAVRDKNGDIMWSWQIWVTPYSPEDGLLTFSYEDHNYEIMARNVGEVSGGDDTYFESQVAKVRFTQITPDGIQPKSITITINRDSKHVITPFCYSFFQWGRKDPMISLIKEWYKADHTEITVLPTSAYTGSSLGNDYIKTGILQPGVFITGSHQLSCDYSNLWNVETSDNNGVKSIYDPSPVGFKLPGIMLRAFDKKADSNAYDVSFDNSNASCPALSFSLPDGKLLMALLGYRASGSGADTGIGNNGQVWTHLIANHSEARCFQFFVSNAQVPVSQFVTDPILEGFGVRPIKE